MRVIGIEMILYINQAYVKRRDNLTVSKFIQSFGLPDCHIEMCFLNVQVEISCMKIFVKAETNFLL